jgi:ribosomal protein S18 acetylase RimI-like enzyme
VRLLAAAGYIDGKVFVRDDDAAPEVKAHVHVLAVDKRRRRRHLAVL